MVKQDRIKELPILGWRELVRLPELGLPWMRAKIDTGARTSALHASDIELFELDGTEYARFKVHPKQRNFEQVVEVEAEVVDHRHVRSSGGNLTYRPVIRTQVEIKGKNLPIELTLICRKKLKFRMLIGREALEGNFLVDSGRSYLGGTKLSKKAKMKLVLEPSTKAGTK